MTLSQRSALVLANLRAHVEGCSVLNDDGNWGVVYVDNARPEDMSARSFAGHLSALKAAGFYRADGDDCFGVVKMEVRCASSPKANAAG